MVNPEKQHPSNDRHIDDVDRVDQNSDGEGSFNDLSSSDGTSASANPSITGRLMEILAENGDGDLLLQRSHREGEVLQWLRALDLQVMGACRVDERLKPMLKLNVSPGAAEDHLLAHLCQVCIIRIYNCLYRLYLLFQNFKIGIACVEGDIKFYGSCFNSISKRLCSFFVVMI